MPSLVKKTFPSKLKNQAIKANAEKLLEKLKRCIVVLNKVQSW
jgi:hypothetical protein